MKVVFIRHSLLSRGGDKMILAHATHLAAMGHDVTIKASIVDTVFPLDERIKIQKIASKSKLHTIRKCLTEAHDSDWVIADIIPLACLLYFRNRQTVLYFAQDYDESYYSFWLQRLFIRGLYFLGLSLFRIPTVAVSSKLEKLLTKRFAARVKVAQNGVDATLFFHDPDDELLSLKKGCKSLVVFARSDYRKGFDLVPEILNLVQKRYGAPFEVWTVGDKIDGGFDGLRHRNFGYVDEVRLRKILSSADLFLYPTRHEGFGLMILEAMLCRCPFVTTEVVPVAEHGKGGFVCPVDDVDSFAAQILELFQMSSVGDELLQKGDETARAYSLENCQNRFEQILYSKFTGDRP